MNKTVNIVMKQTADDAYQLLQGDLDGTDMLQHSVQKELQHTLSIKDDIFTEQLKTIYIPRKKEHATDKDYTPLLVYYAFIKEESLTHLLHEDSPYTALSIDEAKEKDVLPLHQKILFGGLSPLCGEEVNVYEQVQKKMFSSSIAKGLLNDEFTLSELRELLEAFVPSIRLNSSNFIRKITLSKMTQGLIEECMDENNCVKTSKQYSNNAAKLYRFTNEEPLLSYFN